MIQIHNKAGDVIRKSKNLRGVLEYARISPVQSVGIGPAGPGEYLVTFHFADGSRCATVFQSWGVAVRFILGRRSWRWGDWRDRLATNSGPMVYGLPIAVQHYYGEAG